MAISKGNDTNKIIPVANYSIVSPDEVETQQSVTLDTSWSFAWYDNGNNTRREGELFHVGGGNPYNAETAHINDFGTYTLTPENDFYAMVHMWGAGGGNYNSGNSSSRAGGGGFTQGLILFKANTPYALVVGQAGRYNQGNTVFTHGGGGPQGHTSHTGQGGGLTGIFMNSTHRGRSQWFENPPATISQENALIIAGGGGGAGHHATGNHGQAGGGGGWFGASGHNSGGGGQNYGGWANTYANWYLGNGRALMGGYGSRQNTWTGGGGAGWYGGGGGAHSGTHYNGGSGGSGHHAQSDSYGVFPNNKLSDFVVWANTEMSPSTHSSPWQYSANYKNPLAYRSANPTYGEYDGLYAGKGGLGNSENAGRSAPLHGKIVITMVPELVAQNYFRMKQVSSPATTEWVNSDDYSKD
jgi:hypothetical protein